MLTKDKDDIRSQIEMLCLDQLVPEDHLVRKLEAAIDFNFIYDLVSDKYSIDSGRQVLTLLYSSRLYSFNIYSGLSQ